MSCQSCGFQQSAQRASCAQCNADIVSGKEHREDAGEGVVTSTEIRMWNAARLSAGKTVLRCVQKRSRESQQWTRIRQMWNRTVVKGTPEDRANLGKKTWFNNIEHRFRTSEMLEDRQRSIGWTLATARAMGRLVPYAFQYAQRMRDEGHSSVPKWQREEQARCARIQTTRQTAKGGAGSITADPAIARRGQTLDARFPHAMATYRRATGTEPTEEPREEAQSSTWTPSSSSWTRSAVVMGRESIQALAAAASFQFIQRLVVAVGGLEVAGPWARRRRWCWWRLARGSALTKLALSPTRSLFRPHIYFEELTPVAPCDEPRAWFTCLIVNWTAKA